MWSFGGGSSRGMGGGSGGGSMQMIRTVQRAVRAGTVAAAGGGGGGGVRETLSHTNTTRRARQTIYNNNKNQPITLSSSSTTSSAAIFSPYNNNTNLLPTTISTAPPAWPSSCSSPTFTDESDWECIDDDYDDFVFETVPSKDEVHHVFETVPSKDEVHQAANALQEALDPAPPKHLIDERPAYNVDMDIGDQVFSPTGSLETSSPFGSKLDWMEPSLQLCNQSILQARERVYDAFHLLRNEPSVQRMVISLSSDKAVWDAVLNNEVVQELRESFNQDKSPSEKSDDGSDASDPQRDFVSWIIVNAKAKIMELVDKIMKLANVVFHIEEGEKTAHRKADPFEEKLRASFLLSVVVMLIVIVTRSSKA